MFSLSWFTSLAGILITVGVILLIVALVIFIVSKNKGKNKKESGVENMANAVLQNDPTALGVDPNASAVADPNAAAITDPNATSIADPAAVTATATPEVAAQPAVGGVVATQPETDGGSVGISTEVEVPNVYSQNSLEDLNNMVNGNVSADQPVVDPNTAASVAPAPETPAQPAVEMPIVDPNTAAASTAPEGVINNSQPAIDSTPIAPSVDLPVIGGDAPATTDAQPAVDTATPESVVNTETPAVGADTSAVQTQTEISVPSVEQVVPAMQPEVAATPEVPAQPAVEQSQIYGGASPVAPAPAAQPAEQPQIYGGANPLEGTQVVAQPTESAPAVEAVPGTNNQ